MTIEASAPSTTAVRRPALTRDTAMRLARTEYGRYLDQLRSLSPSDWSRPTVCPDWDVHAIAAHQLGMAEFASSIREGMRQYLAALETFQREGGNPTDHLNDLQVEKHRDLDPDRIVERYAAVTDRAARARRRRPAALRRHSMGLVQLPDGSREEWTIGFLVDTILTRDCWMHRMDTARATRRAPELTAEHDGVLVADVVAEWAGRHGEPCTITLGGPAGGRWEFGDGGPDLEHDAVDFCRAVSGRGAASGLLATPVAF